MGNAAAMFALQRLGAEVWAVNTVQFSNHTGYGDWTGQAFTGEQVGALVDGVAARGALARCDAVLSGYVGDAAVGAAVLDAVERVRRANAGAVYCCDPVIGDEGRIYVRPGVAEFLRDRAILAADLATPNQFELEWLTGGACGTIEAARAAAGGLRARMRDGAVLVTSLRTSTTPADSIDLLAADATGDYLLRTPWLPVAVSGAGDLIAALFLYSMRRTGRAAAAMEEAASSVHGVLRRTAAAGAGELMLVAAQEEMVAPQVRFRAERC